MRSRLLCYSMSVFLIGLLGSCKDAQLEEEVLNYCKCIDLHKQDEINRYTCIEMMEALQAKYANKPRKLNALIEQTDQCW